MATRKTTCDCCDSVRKDSSIGRRGFLKGAGAAALTASGLLVPASAFARPLVRVIDPAQKSIAAANEGKKAEDFVKVLYESLKPAQREKLCFGIDHPLRSQVRNNWHIVPEKIGSFLDKDQQEVCREILKGITSEDGYARFQKSMQDDAGGLEDYSCAIFGDPDKGEAFQWVLTGRHLTLRADGNTTENAVFGGPIFYGHAVSGTEKPDHPGNVWWHQGQVANELFKALDGAQREKALLASSPPDEQATTRFAGNSKSISGIAGSEMSKDQRVLLEKSLKSMLTMFRESDVDEALECIKKNGGLESARISFYKEGDLGSDGIWDRWRVEGPAFVWYFRGSPHVHTWVNIGHRGPKWI